MDTEDKLAETLEELRDNCFLTNTGSFAPRNSFQCCLNCTLYWISFTDLRDYHTRMEFPKTREELAHVCCKILNNDLRKERGFYPYNKPNTCKHHEYSTIEYQKRLERDIIKLGLRETGDCKEYRSISEEDMTHATDDNGEKVEYNYDENKWEYPDEPEYEAIHGKKKRICERCGKPRIDINDIDDVDFCMQGLSNCDFITNACCGHGDDSMAYIGLADGRRFILDTEWSRKINYE